ncbi:S8 family peptidase [Halosolutus amylolyticus]|uniref:S8 family peptidase n=1 Tax=Halosolutus amylolyticus TaxID=2932267 RepID=A0ABD5PQF1_9EURY|nr:S8 family peptidase [Halosolutus amylolyticus]
MTDKHVTRRRLLRNTAAGVTATGMAGTAVAQESPGRKIVGLTADAPFGLARKAASEVTHELDFDRVGKVVSGRFPAEAIEGLEKNPNVRYVEDEGTMQALAQTLPWGIDRVDADVLHANGETGNGADIAIIDTGIDADHPDLQANLGTGEDFTGTGSWDDDNGHGTHCAGIADAVDNSEGVVGVSTEATLHAVKVLDSQGSGTYSDIAAGIEWVADQGYDVASLSLGGSSGSSALRDAVQYAQSNGVLLVAAAGNSGPCSDCVGYPAAYSEVMAVSSTNSSDGLSSFSSTGPEIEIAAPGSDIYSTYNDGGYNTLSGTSMACPHVSGAAGQLMANGYTNSEARQTMKDTAEDLGLASNEQGAGLLDAEAAVTGGGSDPVLTVYTDSATGVGETAATLNGTLNDLGGASSADVYFEWGEAGSGLPNTTSTQTLTSTGSFSDDISGLSSGTEYEFRAVASGSDGSSDTGATQSFTTDSGDGGCFITTATAGEGHTLNSLRRFRDESMSATPVGRGLVGLYYRISPPIAETLERNPESLTARTTRSIVDRCASLSDRQDETDSPAESAFLGVVLTMLYVVGILIGAGGHAGIRTRELLDSS